MNKRFRVAFSFAGEKRPFVSEAAAILSRQFGEGSILYDKFHEAEFAHPRLASHLPGLYINESDLVVVVLCNDYITKDWCELELVAICGLIKAGGCKKVLLTRFDTVEIDVMYSLAGYIDLDDRTPKNLVDLIRERLAINEGKDREFYKKNSELHSAAKAATERMSQDLLWPACDQPLYIEVANHIEPQKAFLRLLQQETSFRLLLIEGERLMGKTHLSNEFLGAAIDMGLRCGRMDFKGTIDLGKALRNFADQLGFPSNTSGSVAELLEDLLQKMINNPKPTVLFFDTYESAGEADGWVNSNLLISMIRNPWLRIVISGQRTVKTVGVPWSRHCNRMHLGKPSPEEWWEFAKQRESCPPEVTLDFVRTAYTICDGRSNILADLLSSSRKK